MPLCWYNTTRAMQMVDIAQLVRVPGCGPGGRRFEPDYPPHIFAANLCGQRRFFCKIQYIGVSSSGKTQHFDCCIRRFESCHPSQKSTGFDLSIFYPLRRQWYIINDSNAIVVSHQSIRTAYHHTAGVYKKLSQ